jgi:hypothetical protein
MMGCLKSDQNQLFYEFRLGDTVPEDHLVRKIDAALDLSWLRSVLAVHYSSMGRPSIDPKLMIRMPSLTGVRAALTVINDASSLLCMGFAVATALTGRSGSLTPAARSSVQFNI